MTSNKPPSLAPEVGHIEPLPTPKGISITDFRTLSIHPTIITRPPKTHIIPTIDFRMPGTYPAIVTKPPATYQSSPLLKPGMGLAVETWLHIINFLELEPVALLACALTCHCLRKPAQDMIRALLGPTISTYHDLDALVEEARESPVRARCISGLKIIPEGDKESIPVFSVVPFRLARMLDRIKTLKIGHRWGGGCNTISGHACTWSFYGRAFRSITRLKLYRVCFPSFFDFTSFIISFPALTHLFIQRVQCRSQGVPVSAMQRYQKQGFRLETLCVSSEGQEQDANVRFLAAFVSWFIQRRGIEVRALTMASRIPQSHELVQRLQGHLQTLSLSPEPTSPDFSKIRFDALRRLEVDVLRADAIPWLQTNLPHIYSTESLPELRIEVCPSEEDFHYPAWKVLDVILFAYRFLARRTSKSRSLVSLDPGPGFVWNLDNPINNSTVPHDFHIGVEVLEFTLFPLISSCKEIRDHLTVKIVGILGLYFSIRDRGLEL